MEINLKKKRFYTQEDNNSDDEDELPFDEERTNDFKLMAI